MRDQFLRELLPAAGGWRTRRGRPAVALLNALPPLRLDPTAPLRAAISWNSEATRRMAAAPPFVETVLERVRHPVPPYGDLYAATSAIRRPSR